jgi:hypothetical protein
VANDVTYVQLYRPYRYRGVIIYGYLPRTYHSPAFYRWARGPWERPVAYRWGWTGAPFCDYYESYFVPMPTYASPLYWLVDYLLAAELQEAYAAQMDEPAPEYAEYGEAGASPVTPEVREAIALEVQRQLEAESAAASANQPPPDPSQADVPPVFVQASRAFVVSAALDVLVDEQPCSLSAGDVLRMDSTPNPGDMTATVRVLSSKAGDCAAGSRAILSVEDLQEMDNRFHERLDSGLDMLKSGQGSGGLPPLPGDALPTIAGPGAVPVPPSENAAAAVAETQASADRFEAELGRELVP